MKQLLLIACTSLIFISSKASTYYWVNNGGSWNDYSNHWATTSGGSVFYNQPPTANDDVVFDVNSFTTSSGQIVNLSNGVFTCRNLSWHNVLHAPLFGNTMVSHTATLKVYGSIEMDRSMEYGINGVLSLESTSSTNTISCSLLNRINRLQLNNASGAWTLTDTLEVNYFDVYAGKLNTNNNPFYATRLTSFPGGTKILNLAQSKLEITNWDTYYNPVSDLFVDADSASLRTKDYATGVPIDFHKINLYNFSFNYGAIIGANAHYDSIIIESGQEASIAGNNVSIGYIKSDVLTNLASPFTIGYAEFTKDVSFSQNNTFDTLALYNPGYTTRFNDGKTQTINGTLLSLPSSCAGFINLTSFNPGVSTFIHKASGVINIYNATLMDVTKTGGAAFNAIASYNNGHVSGVNFTAPAPRILYWVGGNGSSDDAIHWSLSSGGSGGQCPPMQMDSVVFDTNSAIDTLEMESIFICKSLSVSAISQPLIINNTQATDFINIYGSISLSPNVEWNYSGRLQFKGTGTNKAISLGGNYIQEIRFGGTGSWKLQDSINARYIYIDQGTLNTNNKTVRAGTIISDQQGLSVNLILGTSSVYVGEWNFTSTTTTINGASASIHVRQGYSDQGHTSLKNLHTYGAGNGSGYVGINVNVITIGTLTCDIATHANYSDTCTINHLIANQKYVHGSSAGIFRYILVKKDFDFSTDIITDSLVLDNPGYTGNIQNVIINNFLHSNNGVCSPYTKIQSVLPGGGAGPGNIIDSLASISIYNVRLEGIHVQGTIINAINSIDAGNNSGWNFMGQASDSIFYWVGGTGNWSDNSHWSYTSGGSASGCSPTPLSSVVFDQNSFSGNDTVFADPSYIAVHNMTWHGLTSSAVLQYVYPIDPNYSWMTITGNLLLDPNMKFNYVSKVVFAGTAVSTFKSNGVNVPRIQVNGAQPYTIHLLDSVSTMEFRQISGTINTHGYPISGNLTFQDTVKLGTSNLYGFSSGIGVQCPPGSFLADSASIYCIEGGFGCTDYQQINNITVSYSLASFGGSNFTVKNFTAAGEDVWFSPNNVHISNALFMGNVEISGSTTFGQAAFNGNVKIGGRNNFDTLLLNNQGFELKIENEDTVFVYNKLYTNSDNGNNIFIHSDLLGSSSHLICYGDTVCMEFLSIQDIDATGSAAPIYAGQYSTNISGNTGINFSACVLPFSNVWPGDANGDGVVNNTDMLYIGLAFNESGYTRAGANIGWTAQSCQDWNRIFTNFVNIKNADCDGNGLVTNADTNAVTQNYSLIHAYVVNEQDEEDNQRLLGANLCLDGTGIYIGAGQIVSIPLKLGSFEQPAEDVYGVAYKLNYDNTKIVPGTISMSYPSSWFTSNSNRLRFSKNFFNAGHMENAHSRKNQTNVTGNGTIAFLQFQVLPGAMDTLMLSISDIKAVDKDGNNVVIGGCNTNLIIGDAIGIQDINTDINYLVFPNPTDGNVRVSYNLLQSCDVEMEITDILGTKVQSISYPQQAKGSYDVEMNLSQLPVGVYQCILRKGLVTQVIRIVKIK